MSHITVNPLPRLGTVGASFAERQYDWTFGHAFSDRTPKAVEACVKRVREGAWHALHVLGGGHVLAMHYLHHMDAEVNSTWVSGWVDPEARGRVQYWLRRQLWESARDWIERDRGFAQLFCYCMRRNLTGQRWVNDACTYYQVGIMLGAVEDGDTMADIVVYTLYLRDEAECRRQAERLFPHGVWEVDESMPAGVFPPME